MCVCLCVHVRACVCERGVNHSMTASFFCFVFPNQVRDVLSFYFVVVAVCVRA